MTSYLSFSPHLLTTSTPPLSFSALFHSPSTLIASAKIQIPKGACSPHLPNFRLSRSAAEVGVKPGSKGKEVFRRPLRGHVSPLQPAPSAVLALLAC